MPIEIRAVLRRKIFDQTHQAFACFRASRPAVWCGFAAGAIVAGVRCKAGLAQRHRVSVGTLASKSGSGT